MTHNFVKSNDPPGAICKTVSYLGLFTFVLEMDFRVFQYQPKKTQLLYNAAVGIDGS